MTISAPSAKLSYQRDKSKEFDNVVRERVSLYFKDKGISSKATSFIYIKTIFLLSAVVLCYLGILSGFGHVAGLLIGYSLLGFLIASAGMNITHDALHGAYFAKMKTNRKLGLLMDLFGASSFYWRKEHTIDHHINTNVAGFDADLDVPFLLRLCPHAPHRAFHRFQQWYAPFLYSINLIRWIYFSDLKRIYRIFKKRQIALKLISFKEALLLTSFKFIHISLFFLLPLLLLPASWWVVLLGYILNLAVTGLTLTVVFQLAHIVENVEFPLPNENLELENSFTTHQLATTANFSRKSRLVTFLLGGLNYQVEHHIFPTVCHTHLPKIAKILKKTALEFNMPYHENLTLFSAIKSHFKKLKELGQAV